MVDCNIQTQLFPIKKLTLLQRNPRKITKEAMEKLIISIKDDPSFLWNRPILVNEIDGKHIVYAGNQRIRAAKKTGMKEIPCIIEQDLSEDLIQKRVLKDNKTYGSFDYDILANEYEIEMLLDCGFTPEELQVDLSLFDDSHDDSKEKEKDKKCKKCPHCGGDV